MKERLNVIAIVCYVSFDSMDKSHQKKSKKIILKNHLNSLFDFAFQAIGQFNRLILITDDGAEIAYLGPPQDAILLAKAIQNEILVKRSVEPSPLTVRIGIHLKQVQQLNALNHHANSIASCIRAARRLAKNANPNEVMVSRSYSKNNPATFSEKSVFIKQKFVKLDSHVLVYNQYLEKLNRAQALKSKSIELDLPVGPTISIQGTETTIRKKTDYWKFALVGIFLPFLMLSSRELANLSADKPINVVKTLPIRKSLSTIPSTSPTELQIEEPQYNNGMQTIEAPNDELVKSETIKPLPTQKKVKQGVRDNVDATSKKGKTTETMSWETLKKSLMQGQKRACTQSETAMNQCQ